MLARSAKCYCMRACDCMTPTALVTRLCSEASSRVTSLMLYQQAKSCTPRTKMFSSKPRCVPLFCNIMFCCSCDFPAERTARHHRPPMQGDLLALGCPAPPPLLNSVSGGCDRLQASGETASHRPACRERETQRRLLRKVFELQARLVDAAQGDVAMNRGVPVECCVRLTTAAANHAVAARVNALRMGRMELFIWLHT